MRDLSLPNLGLSEQSGGSYSAEAKAYFAAMTSQGNGTYKKWINTFIQKLKSDGVYPKLLAAWILANKADTDDLIPASFVNIINPSGVKLVPIGTLSAANGYESYRGWCANATAGRGLNTQIVLNTLSGFDKNSASFGLYSRTDSSVGIGMGVYIPGGDYSATIMSSKDATGKQQNSCNNSIIGGGAASVWDALTPNSSGMHIVNKTAANAIKSYRNGELYKTTTGATSLSVLALAVYLLCINSNTAIASVSDKQISFAFLGKELTTPDITNLSVAITTLMTNTPGGDYHV